MSCERCKCTHTKMTIAEFKKAFKPGDLIKGWSTGKVVRITAIGEERFLYVNSTDFHAKERVTQIAASWLWRKVEK